MAEMTGRKGRVVQSDDGQVMYESRSEADVPLEILNIRGEWYIYIYILFYHTNSCMPRIKCQEKVNSVK